MRCSLLVLASLVLVAADAKEDAVKSAKAKLQGTWDVVTVMRDGKKEPLPEGIRMQMVFDADKLTIVIMDGADKESHEGTYTIDPAQNPPHIDVVPSDGPEKGKKGMGIYRVDKDELKIFIVESGERRPKEFVSKGVKGGLITLKREKK